MGGLAQKKRKSEGGRGSDEETEGSTSTARVWIRETGTGWKREYRVQDVE